MESLLKRIKLYKYKGYKYKSKLSGGKMSCTVLYSKYKRGGRYKDEPEEKVMKILFIPKTKEELELFVKEANVLKKINDSAFGQYTVRRYSDVQQVRDCQVYYYTMERGKYSILSVKST